MAKRSSVQIVFKSGHVQEIECDSFEVTKTNGELVRLEWSVASPRIMQIDLSEVAAIFEKV